jgi:hypothetical protein
MSSDTPVLIEQAVTRFLREVPALEPLKLTFALELRAKGDIQAYTVTVPGPVIAKGVPDHARVRVEVVRSRFNVLAEKGTVADWREAFEVGDAKADGDSNMLKLIAQVVAKHEERGRLRRAH